MDYSVQEKYLKFADREGVYLHYSTAHGLKVKLVEDALIDRLTELKVLLISSRWRILTGFPSHPRGPRPAVNRFYGIDSQTPV